MNLQNLLKIMNLLLWFLRSMLRSRSDLIIENLALRQQLAILKHKKIRLSISWSDRAFWVFLKKFWSSWKNSLIIVSPDTVVRWHRKGFRLYWKAISQNRRSSGRPAVSKEIRDLILRIASENLIWGAPKIHAELLMQGFKASERTVSGYMPKQPPNPDKLKLWIAFLHNHRDSISAMDFFTIPLVTFRLLYVLVIIHHGRRVLLYVNVTFHPTAYWVIQQIREAFPFESSPGFLIFDRDSIFSSEVVEVIRSFGIKPVRTSFRSPWQNGVMERWVGSCRRELLDHVIVFNQRQALRLLREYIAYYNNDRCHLTLSKDAPESREIQQRQSVSARVVSLPKVGGLHYRYEWRNAA